MPVVPARLSVDRIARAASAIDPVFTGTPQFVSDALSARLGARVLCKVETVNPIRSFKGRGADLFCASLPRGAHVVCASAGNFGQGMAYAARARGMTVTVFAAGRASSLKVERMRALGATVHLGGADLDEAKARGRAWAAARELPFVEDGREVAISEGAGTIGVELAAWGEPIDALFVPVGNGALLAGVATWMRARSPRTRIVAVSAEGAPAMARSWRAARVERTDVVETIADGIAVREPIPEAVADLQPLVDAWVLVSDDAIRRAMRCVYEDVGLLVEPAGAVGIAAIAESRDLGRDALVATPLCGSNLTDEQARAWIWSPA